jgi:methylmalonyl-CoA/ethylmalonyl-CoA epimerase
LFKVTGLDHVGIAVFDLEKSVPLFTEKFGLPLSKVVESKPRGLKFAIVRTGNSILELMEPTDNTGTVAKFLKKQGRNALHHLAFSVDSDLLNVAKDLKNLGIEMVSPTPTVGVLGHPINFCHPQFTGNILIELCDVGFESRSQK